MGGATARLRASSMRYARRPSRRAWAIPITSPLAPEQRLIDIAPDDLARAPGEQTRTLKIEHAARRKQRDNRQERRQRARGTRVGRDCARRGRARGQMQEFTTGKLLAV